MSVLESTAEVPDHISSSHGAVGPSQQDPAAKRLQPFPKCEKDTNRNLPQRLDPCISQQRCGPLVDSRLPSDSAFQLPHTNASASRYSIPLRGPSARARETGPVAKGGLWARGEGGGEPPAPPGWDRGDCPLPSACPHLSPAGTAATSASLSAGPTHLLRAGRRPPAPARPPHPPPVPPPLSAGGKEKDGLVPCQHRPARPRSFESGSPPSGLAGRQRQGGCEGRAAVVEVGETGSRRPRPPRLCGGTGGGGQRVGTGVGAPAGSLRHGAGVGCGHLTGGCRRRARPGPARPCPPSQARRRRWWWGSRFLSPSPGGRALPRGLVREGKPVQWDTPRELQLSYLEVLPL